MQRGFGMGNQLLILTARLKLLGGSAPWASGRGSCSPRCCQVVLFYYWWGLIFIRQNGAPVALMASTSFVFMASYTNQQLCFSLKFLARSMICPPTTSISPLHCHKPHFFPSQHRQWFSITLHLPWLWTVNSPALTGRGLEGLPWQRSPSSLLLLFFSTIDSFTLSPCSHRAWILPGQNCIIIHLFALIVSPLGVSNVSAVCRL